MVQNKWAGMKGVTANKAFVMGYTAIKCKVKRGTKRCVKIIRNKAKISLGCGCRPGVRDWELTSLCINAGGCQGGSQVTLLLPHSSFMPFEGLFLLLQWKFGLHPTAVPFTGHGQTAKGARDASRKVSLLTFFRDASLLKNPVMDISVLLSFQCFGGAVMLWVKFKSMQTS